MLCPIHRDPAIRFQKIVFRELNSLRTGVAKVDLTGKKSLGSETGYDILRQGGRPIRERKRPMEDAVAQHDG